MDEWLICQYLLQQKPLIIVFCLCFKLFRTLGLRRPGVSSMVGVLLILAFTSHVSYLTFVSFDYGYNMAANTSIGTASS